MTFQPVPHAIILLFAMSGLAQATAPKLTVTEAVKRLQGWISTDQDLQRNYNKDAWVGHALRVLDENYEHPEVQNFV
ncbi:MAG: hypothetical protein K2X47_19485, partial [Bdellovibrionales bacterium]|nr:hypothetical protein [Bdellovibrionales bacterium]